MSKARVTDSVRIDGIVTIAPSGFGRGDRGVSVRIESSTLEPEGAAYGIVVTNDSIPAALSLHVGQRVTCVGTLLSWPGKDLDELWGDIAPYANTAREAA